jgi:hypothetical protein
MVATTKIVQHRGTGVRLGSRAAVLRLRERQLNPSKPTIRYVQSLVSSVPIADIWRTSPNHRSRALAIIKSK